MSTSALPLGNHSDPFGEGYCCGFFNYHVGSGTTAVSLAGVASSAVLCISLSTTVILLQRAYTRSYTRDRLPLDALLRRSGSGVDGSGHARASDRDRSSGGVLPAYHGFALGVCLLFFLQAAAWLLPQQAPYDKLSTTVFALCTFVDLVPVIHMTRGPRARFWTSMAAGAVLAVLLLVFVMLLRTTIDCEWCSLHFPRPGVQYADAAFGLYFLVVGILSRKRLKIWPMRRPPRPALAPWAFTLAFTYLLSAIAIWLLTSKVSSDLQEAAFCMLDIVLIQYALMYAPMFYRAIVADSEFMRRRDMKAALQGSAFAPLLSSGHGDVDHGTFYNNLDSDSDRDATGTSGSVGLQAVGAVGAGGVGAAGGGGGSKQQRKRNTSSSKSAAKARNRHEDDDDHDDENDDIDEGLQAMVNDPNLHMIGVNDVVLHRRVGSGGYGNVWFAEWRGCACAVKELFALAPHQQGLPVAQAREAARALLHEVAVLARLRHPHCVLFYGLIISQRLHGIVTEYMDGGSVHDLMHVRRRKFSLEDKKRVLRHCASGMHYLHTLDTPLLHRDLKTKNLLVDEHCTVIKVTDFGLATAHAANETMTAVGTPAWAAPEVLRHERYSTKADVYSYACVAWELINETPPWHGMKPLRVAHAVAYENKRPRLAPGTSTEMQTMLALWWHEDPAQRPDFDFLSKWSATMDPSIFALASVGTASLDTLGAAAAAPAPPASPHAALGVAHNSSSIN